MTSAELPDGSDGTDLDEETRAQMEAEQDLLLERLEAISARLKTTTTELEKALDPDDLQFSLRHKILSYIGLILAALAFFSGIGAYVNIILDAVNPENTLLSFGVVFGPLILLGLVGIIVSDVWTKRRRVSPRMRQRQGVADSATAIARLEHQRRRFPIHD